jgi:hypothetical protein
MRLIQLNSFPGQFLNINLLLVWPPRMRLWDRIRLREAADKFSALPHIMEIGSALAIGRRPPSICRLRVLAHRFAGRIGLSS